MYNVASSRRRELKHEVACMLLDKAAVASSRRRELKLALGQNNPGRARSPPHGGVS